MSPILISTEEPGQMSRNGTYSPQAVDPYFPTMPSTQVYGGWIPSSSPTGFVIGVIVLFVLCLCSVARCCVSESEAERRMPEAVPAPIPPIQYVGMAEALLDGLIAHERARLAHSEEDPPLIRDPTEDREGMLKVFLALRDPSSIWAATCGGEAQYLRFVETIARGYREWERQRFIISVLLRVQTETRRGLTRSQLAALNEIATVFNRYRRIFRRLVQSCRNQRPALRYALRLRTLVEGMTGGSIQELPSRSTESEAPTAVISEQQPHLQQDVFPTYDELRFDTREEQQLLSEPTHMDEP